MQRRIGILLNYLNEGVKILTVLLYTPVMLRLLGQAEYGLYQMTASVVSHLHLLSMGFGSAYVRYFARCRSKQEEAVLNGMFLLVFSVLAGVCLLCGIGITLQTEAIFGEGLTDRELQTVKGLIPFLVASVALTLINSVFDCHIAAREQFVFQKLLRLAQSLLSPFLTLPLLMLGFGSEGVVLVSALLTAGGLILNGSYCIKKLQMRFCFRGLPVPLFRELWGFTFFIFLNQLIDQINWSTDKFLLGRLRSPEETAIYGVGAQIHSLYLHLSTGISSLFVPRVHRIAAQTADNCPLNRLLIQVGRVQLCILGLVLTGFACFGKAFIKLWAGELYVDSYAVALLLMIPMTVPLIQNLGIEIQRARNKHRARSVVYFCLAVGNIGISLLLIPRWGSIGTAAGTALTQMLGTWLFMNWYYQKKLRLDMIGFWKSISQFCLPILLSMLAGWVLSRQPITGWGDLLAACGLYTVQYSFWIWHFALNPQEKNKILSVWKGKKCRYGKTKAGNMGN